MSPTILIVDDDERFLATARLLLEAEGFSVVGQVTTARDALAATGTLRPDLVLLDVHLPDGDGFDVAEQIAAGEHPPPVVLTSSRDGLDYGGLVARSSARAFIPKGEISGAALAAYCG